MAPRSCGLMEDSLKCDDVTRSEIPPINNRFTRHLSFTWRFHTVFVPLNICQVFIYYTFKACLRSLGSPLVGGSGKSLWETEACRFSLDHTDVETSAVQLQSLHALSLPT